MERPRTRLRRHLAATFETSRERFWVNGVCMGTNDLRSPGLTVLKDAPMRYRKIGGPKHARESYRKALEISPESPEGRQAQMRLEEQAPAHPLRRKRCEFEKPAFRHDHQRFRDEHPTSAKYPPRTCKGRSPNRRTYPGAEISLRKLMIHRILSALAIAQFALFVGCSSTQPHPLADAARPSRKYDVAEFMNTMRLSGPSFFADGKRVLISSDETGIINAFSVHLADGARTQLTFSTQDAVQAVSPFPKDDRILFLRNNGGNENDHLYVRNPDGSERDLTPAPGVKAGFAGWRKDGEAFFVRLNERDRRFFDLFEFSTEDYSRRLLFQDDVGYGQGPISDDGQWLSMITPQSFSSADMHLFHIPSRQMCHLSEGTGVAGYPQCFDPSSEWLYYLTHDGGDFLQARRYHLRSGRQEEVENAPWDVQYVRFSPHGRYRYSGTNQDGRTVVRLVDSKTGRRVRLPALPAGEMTEIAFSANEDQMAFLLDGGRSPSDLWRIDLTSGTAQQLIRSLSASVDPEDLVDVEVVRFEASDGMVIPNILWRPHRASAKSPAPALVFVNGGPGGQWRQTYFSLSQFLANQGYVVLGVNIRGSSGYGRRFNMADDRRHTEEPLRDLVEAKNWLTRQAYVDAQRIAVVGGSYGGFMVLATLAFHPEVFEAGVDFFGPSNWIRTLENIPPHAESFRKAAYEEMGNPETDRDRLRAMSPLFHADRIKKPLLVVQGGNDVRVLKQESEEIVEAVRRNGVPVEYLLFPDEGHNFTKRTNSVAAWRKVHQFLDRELHVQP